MVPSPRLIPLKTPSRKARYYGITNDGAVGQRPIFPVVHAAWVRTYQPLRKCPRAWHVSRKKASFDGTSFQFPPFVDSGTAAPDGAPQTPPVRGSLPFVDPRMAAPDGAPQTPPARGSLPFVFRSGAMIVSARKDQPQHAGCSRGGPRRGGRLRFASGAASAALAFGFCL